MNWESEGVVGAQWTDRANGIVFGKKVAQNSFKRVLGRIKRLEWTLEFK